MELIAPPYFDHADEPDRINFLGLKFCPYDTRQSVNFVLNHLREKHPFTYVVTPNVDHMVRLDKEPELLPLYESAGLNVSDSRILEVFAKLDGKTLPASPGADVVEELIHHHIHRDERIVIIGANTEIIEGLARDFGFSNLSWHEPPMGLRKNPEAIDAAARFIIENNEDIAFLCVGSPQQEMIAKRVVELGGAKGIGLCCGASLEFITGHVTRAPKWMRENRLEWLHRLLSEPKRMWKRYLVDGPKILAIWWKHRGK